MHLDHQIAAVCHEIAQGHQDGAGVLADLLEEHGHPLAGLMRRYVNESGLLNEHGRALVDHRYPAGYTDINPHYRVAGAVRVEYRPNYDDKLDRVTVNFPRARGYKVFRTTPEEMETLATGLHAHYNSPETAAFQRHVQRVRERKEVSRDGDYAKELSRWHADQS